MAEQTPSRIGTYEILKRLAVGGMGKIFLARQIGIAGFERLVAVKTMLQSSEFDRQSIDMFFDEARLAATLNHPNIVSIYELGRHDDLYFIAMEYIAGIDLSWLTRLLRQARMHVPPRIGAAIFRSAALALDFAHHATDMRGKPLNIIHRDVSPQNIMVRLDGGVKVVDFGIAQAASRFSQTVGDVIKGKLRYMSPEQVRGQTLSAASDQFSLGVVAWELFALKNLFQGETPAATMMSVANTTPAPLTEVRRSFAPEMSAIVLRMLDREPANRYPSCADAARAMQAYLDATGGSADRELAAMINKIAGTAIAERGTVAEPVQADLPQSCASCGASSPPATKFCSRCGAPLATAGLNPTVAVSENGSDRLPSLNLIEISGAMTHSEPLEGPATVRDVGMALTVGGAVVVRDGAENLIEFGDVVETGALELNDGALGERLGPKEPVLVGRKNELDFLERQLDAACQGRARSVLLVGDEGAGKSRLLRELAVLGPSRDCITSHVVSLRRGVPLALDLFRQWVIGIGHVLVHKKKPAPESADTVATALNGLADEVVPEPVRRRLVQLFDSELFEIAHPPLAHAQRQVAALLHFLERIAAQRPLLLLAEDIHGADQMSVDLLQKLTERLPGARICVVATATPSHRDQLRRGFDVRELPPLDLADLRSLVQSIAALGELPGEFDEQIRDARGNPTVAVHLVRSLKYAPPVGAAALGGRGAPRTSGQRNVRDCVATLLQQLSAEAVEVVGAAALLGELFSIANLERFFPAGSERVQVATQDARQLGLLQLHGTERRYLRFAQGSFRRIVLAELADKCVRRLHMSVVPLLQRPDALPLHEAREALAIYAMASEAARSESVPYLELAAASLFRQGVIGPAIELLGRAVDISVKVLVGERTIDDAQAGQVLRLGTQLACCLQQIDPGRGSALLLHLLDQVPPLRAMSERPAVFLRLAQCLRLADRQQPAAAALEQGLNCPALEHTPELRAMLDAEKALLLASSGGYQGAVFLLTDALDTLGRTPVPPGGDVAMRYDQLSEYYCHLARAHFGTGHPERAQRAIDRARKVARFGQQMHSEARALRCAAETTDDPELALECLTKAVATAEALFDPLLQAETFLACGCALRERDPTAARNLLTRAQHSAQISGRRDLAEAARAASEGGSA